ncbi:MAG: MoaD/ThiS family protein [Pseudanabaenaceae cyanobacterium]
MITVRLLAILRELAGTDTLTLEIPMPATVQTVQAEAIARYPTLAPWVPHLRYAINGQWAEPMAAVQPGDEVALLPPVSGG